MVKADQKSKKIAISNEVLEYLIPLNDEERNQLEKNILLEGCRDPLIVWSNSKGQLILIDGHNRLKICQKHNLPYKIKEIRFKDLDQVKNWMVDNQMGRRNLTPDQLSYYRGLKYLNIKKKKGGFENVQLKGKSEASTSELVGSQFNVSESTIKRDAKYAEGLNIIARSNPKLKLKILLGEASVKKTDIQVLANSPNSEKINIRNEADLYNKAKAIKDQILSDLERAVKNIEKEKIEKSQEILKSSEPIFLKKDDRIRKIKGMIISAINRAINDKDSDAIKELKKLIDKLEDLLFE